MITSYIDSPSKSRIISETSSFDFTFKKKNYIISVHHGLPIINSFLNDIELIKLHDPIWNELIIFSNEQVKDKSTKYKIMLPIKDDILYVNTIEIIVIDYTFINLNSLPTNPRNIYIKAYSDNAIIKSMSGLPVTNANNDIIGILCKTDNCNNIYILPIYYLIKTLTKINNDSIYDINIEEPIRKINNNLVKDDKIYHTSLKKYIYIDTYYLLEGDINKTIKINDTIIEFQDISNDLMISNNRSLEMVHNKSFKKMYNEQFLLNSCLIKIIHEEFSYIFREFFNFIKQNIDKQILVTYTNKIKEINKIGEIKTNNYIILNIDEYYLICTVYNE